MWPTYILLGRIKHVFNSLQLLYIIPTYSFFLVSDISNNYDSRGSIESSLEQDLAIVTISNRNYLGFSGPWVFAVSAFLNKSSLIQILFFFVYIPKYGLILFNICPMRNHRSLVTAPPPSLNFHNFWLNRAIIEFKK